MSVTNWSYTPTRWDVDNDTYHADTTAESSTTIRDFLTSERLYRAKYVDKLIPPREAKHFVLGTLVHEMLLEGHELTDARYVMIPEAIASMDKRTKKYKAAYDEWSGDQPNLPYIAPDVWETAHAMERAVYEHPIAREILNGRVETELGMKWIDAQSEIPCKCRLDMLADWEGYRTTVEFKSSRRPAQFVRDVFDHGYHIQAAMYTDAASRFEDPVIQETWPEGPGFNDPARHVFIVVDNQQPYQCEVFRTSNLALEYGRIDVRLALNRMAEIRDGGSYRESETQDAAGLIEPPKWFHPRSFGTTN